ncbi:hypothetical protein H8356DRAFT_1326038 [Neocallimastix lanati (nom. inval.)]|nr:hypothetical protein H8356DRAFT_1326038 [Neocallimastix sp. JGI-2020a]
MCNYGYKTNETSNLLQTIEMNAIPKVSSYIYLENPFLSFTRFSSNKTYSYCIQGKKVLQSFVISKCIGSFSKNGSKTRSENNDYIKHNSTMSTYALSRDLSIPPIIKSFTKWEILLNLFPKCLIIPWTKESREHLRYWKSVSKFQGINGQNYDSNNFSNNKAIIMLSLKYSQFNLGFSWIIRRVSEDCPNSCPCCGEDKQSFEHWIFKCDALASFRWNSLNFIDDLYRFILFLPMNSISDFEDYINHYIYLFLLGGTLVLNELHFDSGEKRQLNELLFKGSSESHVPKIVGLAEFLTRAIPIISSSFEQLYDRYCKIPNLSKSGESRPSSSINDESRGEFSGYHTIYFKDHCIGISDDGHTLLPERGDARVCQSHQNQNSCTLVKVIGNGPTLCTMTDKSTKAFTFTTCFNIAEHFEYTILLRQNFLEKHKIYSRYDNQGKRTTKIVSQERNCLDYPTENNTCLITVITRIIATESLQELLIKPTKKERKVMSTPVITEMDDILNQVQILIVINKVYHINNERNRNNIINKSSNNDSDRCKHICDGSTDSYNFLYEIMPRASSTRQRLLLPKSIRAKLIREHQNAENAENAENAVKTGLSNSNSNPNP